MADFKSLYMRKRGFILLVSDLDKLNIADKYPSFTPVLDSLRARLIKVESLPIAKNRTRNSDLKKDKKRRLARAAWVAGCGVFAYSRITGNLSMKNAVKYAVSDFYRPAEATVIGRVKQILNAAKKIKNPEHFGLTPAVMNNLRIEFKSFLDFKNIPQIEVKKHAQALRHADKLLNQCLSIIRFQLDPLIVAVSETEKRLAKVYSLNRKTEKCPGRKRKYIKKQKLVVEENKIVLPVISEHQPGNITLAFAD